MVSPRPFWFSFRIVTMYMVLYMSHDSHNCEIIHTHTHSHKKSPKIETLEDMGSISLLHSTPLTPHLQTTHPLGATWRYKYPKCNESPPSFSMPDFITKFHHQINKYMRQNFLLMGKEKRV